MSSLFFTFRVVSKTFKKGRKYAVVISKKIEKSAVKRNLLKRRIFSILRDNIPESFNGAIIVFPKKDSNKLSFSDLKKELLLKHVLPI
ncbi:MAG: ribonuclease P protein component [Patescibacteria group bacterium]|nr:ribonuclease P protein component [Patescibacteria group bacterium]